MESAKGRVVDRAAVPDADDIRGVLLAESEEVLFGRRLVLGEQGLLPAVLSADRLDGLGQGIEDLFREGVGRPVPAGLLPPALVLPQETRPAWAPVPDPRELFLDPLPIYQG
jgi:hypothetical protein